MPASASGRHLPTYLAGIWSQGGASNAIDLARKGSTPAAARQVKGFLPQQQQQQQQHEQQQLQQHEQQQLQLHEQQQLQHDKPEAGKARSSTVPLRRPNIVVRVRPLATTGGHSDEGIGDSLTEVCKELASWDNGAIVMEETRKSSSAWGGSHTTKRAQTFTFPKHILGIEAKQDEVYDAVAAKLVRAVCCDGFNGLVFAYGQTGTGKTHTIFGPERSWRSVRGEDCGILPRAVCAIFEEMRARADTTSFTLTASALEFYMTGCLDLLDEGARCHIGADHKPLGLVAHPIEDDSACLRFMAQVREKRHARGTMMNAAGEGGTGGSSRSHCSVILTLRQLERKSGTVRTTELHIMDMAGAERPKSNGYEAGESNGMLAVIESEKKGEPSLASQGMIINYELSELRTAVVQASEAHQKGLPLLNARTTGSSLAMAVGSTDFIAYTKGCFDGSALLSMIVTLSPAKRCGWETHFSCTYGEDLTKLRCPVQPQSSKDLARLISAKQAAIAKLAAELDTTTDCEKTAAESKYRTKRAAQLRHHMRELEELSRLAEIGQAADRSLCAIS